MRGIAEEIDKALLEQLMAPQLFAEKHVVALCKELKAFMKNVHTPTPLFNQLQYQIRGNCPWTNPLHTPAAAAIKLIEKAAFDRVASEEA